MLRKVRRTLTPPGNRIPIEEGREQHQGPSGVGEQPTPAGQRNDTWQGGV